MASYRIDPDNPGVKMLTRSFRTVGVLSLAGSVPYWWKGT
jgi:hypothetical protein